MRIKEQETRLTLQEHGYDDDIQNLKFLISFGTKHIYQKYRYTPHNDVSVNDGPHVGRWSHKIII